MNKAAEDFFANLPKESETEPEFNLMQDEPEKDKTDEEKPEEPKEEEHIENERKKPLRSERREQERRYYEEKLAEEREARIRLETRLDEMAKARKVEADPDIKKILLGEIKDADEAAQMFEGILSKAEQRAEERAYQRMIEAQSARDKGVNEILETIERSLEAIEDHYGVDLTDDIKTRNEFLDFVESIAPEDEDSDELPNMRTAWQLFQSTRKAPVTESARKAQVSSRSMTRSVSPRPSGENLQPVTFDSLNRGNWWERHIKGQ